MRANFSYGKKDMNLTGVGGGVGLVGGTRLSAQLLLMGSNSSQDPSCSPRYSPLIKDVCQLRHAQRTTNVLRYGSKTHLVGAT